MTCEEAHEWLRGIRSTTNLIPQDPLETWQVRIAQGDAAMMEQAYWVLRIHAERILFADECDSYIKRQEHGA